jgi:RimJ/RimL family protein N-acetyltransferase
MVQVRSLERKYAQLPRLFRWFSDHCVFRQLDEADVSRIWRAALHPAFERCWSAAVPHSEAEVAELVCGAQRDWLRGLRYAMAVTRKQTHEFVGTVELRADPVVRGAWQLEWFLHPHFVADPIAAEAMTAAADLLFAALNATTLHARCLPGQRHVERLLNEAGFIEIAPAGSLDPRSGEPRPYALYELGCSDHAAMRTATAANAPAAPVRARAELALV